MIDIIKLTDFYRKKGDNIEPIQQYIANVLLTIETMELPHKLFDPDMPVLFPNDAKSFGHIVELAKNVPGIQEKLHLMKTTGYIWIEIIKDWIKLVDLYFLGEHEELTKKLKQIVGKSQKLKSKTYKYANEFKELDEFLLEYAKSCNVRLKKSKSIMKHICEDYLYSPQKRDIIFMFYGWILANTRDYIEADTLSALFEKELKEAYAKVSDANNWSED